MAAEPKKMVRLRSSDGVTFEVEERSICAASRTINGVLMEEGRAAADVVPLPDVINAATLSRVLDYVREHYDEQGHREFYLPISGLDHPLSGFDKDFLKVDDDTLFDVMLAAGYLGMDDLVELMCRGLAEQMKGKTPEELRQRFGIVNDYTKEEEEEVRKEIAWASELFKSQ
ncbi:hypothetical protein PR202_ga10606 [Eleusine coracana subsp. coracana]|uniref:SKP1-like protein n=1 Tax=Eleusine coracana subsp. coracana TaxID=191504 RepID=A0AAV5C712_ELECO|nr:hypothetical protein PR202_ga10606 [Eleusine coracana subsp. coracana]